MEWDQMMNQDWDADQGYYDKRREAEQANRVITSVVDQLINSSGIQDLDPNSADFGQQAVGRQGSAASAALRALGSDPNIASVGPAQFSGLTNNLMKTALSPQEFQMKQWELQKNRRELQEQRAGDQQALQAQKAAERLVQEQERKTKAREIQLAVEQGIISRERGQQAIEVLFGLQPQAKQPVTSIQEFERAKTDPEYAAFLDKFRKIQNQGGGEGGDKASNYVIQTDDQGNLLRINKMTGAVEPLGVKGKGTGVKPLTRADKNRAQNEANKVLNDWRNYELTEEEAAELGKLPNNRIAIRGRGKQLTADAQAQLDQISETYGLPRYVETRSGAPKEWTEFLGVKWGEKGGYKYNYAPEGGGQQATQTPAAAQQQNAMPSMPPAASAAGRTIRDTATGKRYQSTGKKWVEIK